MIKHAAIIACLSAVACGGVIGSASAQDVPRVLSRTYGAEPSQRVDLFGSVPGQPKPAVVLIHGAVAEGQDPLPMMAGWGEAFARRGLVAVAPRNHLGLEQPNLTGGLADLQAALTWLEANADDLGVDRSRICLVAFSAGGPLLMPWIHGEQAGPVCLAGVYPVLDVEHSRLHRAETSGVLQAFSGAPSTPSYSAIPLLVVRAGADDVPDLLSGVDRFVLDAARVNYPLSILKADGLPHAFDLRAPGALSEAAIETVVEHVASWTGLPSTVSPPASLRTSEQLQAQATGLEAGFAATRDPALSMLLIDLYAALDKPADVRRHLASVMESGKPFAPPRHSPVWRLPDPGVQAAARQLNDRLVPTERGQRLFAIDSERAPEGIAYDPSSGAYYFGDLRRREVLVRQDDGEVRVVARLPLSPLGMTLDPAGAALWVATTSAPFGASDTASQLVRIDLAHGTKRSFSPSESASFNDVSIAADGAVYVSDTSGGRIWRLAPNADALAPLTEAGAMTSPNGLTIDPSGRTLYVAQGRSLMRISTATGEIARLDVPPDFDALGVDGLYYRNGALFAVQGILNQGRVLRLKLDRAGTTVTQVETLDLGHPDFDQPTTGVFTGTDFVVLAGTQLSRMSDTPPRTPEHAVQVLRYPLQ